MSELYFTSSVFAHSKAPSVATLRSLQELAELVFVEVYMTNLERFGEAQEVIFDIAHGYYENIIYGDQEGANFNIDLSLPQEDVRRNIRYLVDRNIMKMEDADWLKEVYDQILSQLSHFAMRVMEFPGMISDIRYTPLTLSSGLLTVYIDTSYA